jgi:hypothetical protein
VQDVGLKCTKRTIKKTVDDDLDGPREVTTEWIGVVRARACPRAAHPGRRSSLRYAQPKRQGGLKYYKKVRRNRVTLCVGDGVILWGEDEKVHKCPFLSANARATPLSLLHRATWGASWQCGRTPRTVTAGSRFAGTSDPVRTACMQSRLSSRRRRRCAEETMHGRQRSHLEQEVFESPHTDDAYVDAIDRKARAGRGGTAARDTLI